MPSSTVTLTDGMAFTAEVDGFRFDVDAAREVGGTERGPRPKTLVLTAIGGCTAMDVISILRKMRMEPTRLAVEVTSELSQGHPRVFTGVVVKYHIDGEDLPVAKLRRAIELSFDNYCGVLAMLRPSVPLSWELWLNGAHVVDELAPA